MNKRELDEAAALGARWARGSVDVPKASEVPGPIVASAQVRETPIFSLCHCTARVPGGWEKTCERWRRACDRPERVEYVLSIHRRQEELSYSPVTPFFRLYRDALLTLRLWWPDTGVLAINPAEPTLTNNGNMASACSSGRVLVDVNDDLLPCDGWDTALLEAIERAGGLDRDFVVKVSHGDYHPELITHPVLSRSYYERIGPVDTAYLAYGADDEATARAYRHGVVIDAPQIVFEHLDWRKGQRPKDAIDEWNNRPEVWKNRAETLERRIAPAKRKTLAVCTPGTPFDARWLAEWDKAYAWLLNRYTVWRAYTTGNNIFQVRGACCEMVAELFPEPPDYVLWIDSDNPPRQSSIEWLLAAMETSEVQGERIDVIGGWYRMNDARGVVAAGGMTALLPEKAVSESRSLIECEAGIGFGLLLMRGSVLAGLGPDAFWPAYVEGRKSPLTDDWSWCHRARAAGFKLWLHPMAFVEHLKFDAVPARAGISEKGETGNGDNINSGHQPSDVQELDHH